MLSAAKRQKRVNRYSGTRSPAPPAAPLERPTAKMPRRLSRREIRAASWIQLSRVVSMIIAARLCKQFAEMLAHGRWSGAHAGNRTRNALTEASLKAAHKVQVAVRRIC